MGARIVRKSMAINNPNNKRIMYVVDGVYIMPTKKKADDWVNKFDSKGRRK